MTRNSISDRLAVCSWSLRPRDPADLIAQLRQVGIPKVQLALDLLREEPGVWGRSAIQLADAGITIVSGMFGGVGEDYSTLDSIRRTGGVAPDTTWPRMWDQVRQCLRIAVELKLTLVTFHAGFLPHDRHDPTYTKLLDRVAQIADAAAAAGLQLCLETGQEDAPTLKQFLSQLNKPNVGVNFDPANMILYDKGEPVAAIRTLGPYLRHFHIKDAIRTRVPGEWGREVVVGTGEVDWPGVLSALRDIGFEGHLAIEREAGPNRIADIKTAGAFIIDQVRDET